MSDPTLDFDIAVLSAGRPHRGNTPAVLQKASLGGRVLDWMLDTYGARPQDVTFVAGYQAEEIRARYPHLRMVVNENWEETGSLQSLLLATGIGTRPVFVNYGDVLVRKELIAQMNTLQADVVVAVDSTRRDAVPSTEKTGREWVSVVNGRATRLGYDLAQEWADAEFVGMVRFSPAALALLGDAAQNSGALNNRAGLSEALEYLRARGQDIHVVDTAGQWVEIIEARDIAEFVLGTKADTLQRLRSVLERGTIQEVRAFTVADWTENAEAVLSDVRAQFVGKVKNLVVRSSARSEDTFHSSNAGGYDSVLNVDPHTGLHEAIVQVIGSYGSAEPDDQVLVQPMLEGVRLSGVAFTRTSEHYAPYYVINYDRTGSTEAVTAGTSSDHLTLFVQRDADLGSVPDAELRPVIDAIREIEDRLGYDTLDIEFAVDTAGVVHVFQVRPIAIKAHASPLEDTVFHDARAQAAATWNRLAAPAPHLPVSPADGAPAPIYSVMTDWNPAEIIGTAPGRLAETLYRFLIMDNTWAAQRAEYGYRDLRPQPLLVSMAGRPYVDVRASLASFIPAALDDELAGRLLASYIRRLAATPALHDKVEFDIVPTCLAPDFESWATRLTTEDGFSDADVAALRAGLADITKAAFTRCQGDLDQLKLLETRHAAIQAADLDPLERARLLLHSCRTDGTLPFSHLARSGFVAVTLLREAEAVGALSAEARASFMSTIRSVSHTFTSDTDAVAAGDLAWEDYVARYGHLRPGTYDITSPRYDADEERFLRPQVLAASQTDGADSHDSGQSAEAWLRERPTFLAALAQMGLPDDPDMVETFLHQAIEGREYAKFIFSRSLSDAIEALAEVGAGLGLTRDDLADLSLDTLMGLRDTAVSKDAQLAQLRAEIASNAGIRGISQAMKLPPILTSVGDFDAFLTGAELANFVGQAEIVSECVDLEHATADTMPEVAGRIALIPQADPGYDWLFGQGITGLVTMYGGANSHMAIRAAEFGMPAAIGIGEQRYRDLAGAQILRLDPLNQILQAVS